MKNIPVIIKTIKQEMERREWSVQELAAEAGVNFGNLYEVFAGRTSPTVETVEKLVAALDMRLAVTLK